MEQLNVADELKVPIDFTDKELPPSVNTFRPLLFHDGNAFCCVLGPDPQEGVFGCGESPKAALMDWDKHLQERIAKHKENDPVATYIDETLRASVNKVW